MAYGYKRYRTRRRLSGLHGQRLHRFRSRKFRRKARAARVASRRAYRKAVRLPKRLLAKTYANTVGQIAFKRGRTRPSHRRL